jgi:hypothetical protein
VDAIEVEPGIGIGPVQIGMTRHEVITAAEAAGMDVQTVRRWSGRPEVLIVADQVQAYFSPDDVVEQVESAMSPTPVRYGAIDLGGRAANVKAALDRIAEPDTGDRDFPASFCYPALGLCLWQDAKPSDWRQEEPYESVLVQAAVGRT